MQLEVTVTGGAVRGAQETGHAVFRGIPYASSSVRFGAPGPVEPWDGVRDATTYGPPPPQSSAFGMSAHSVAGEDWLSLNIWSPDLGGGLPVMVWIQGGAYLFGRSGLPEYDGSNLARGGVVLVTFNYRVGLEGFGYVDGLPANRGLLDQVSALEWVQANIGAFGGDPANVTVFGQSAGGGSVAALLAMPRATGLFRRAIVQSMPGTYFTPRLAADITRACAAELSLQPSDLASTEPDALPPAADSVLATMAGQEDRWGRAAHTKVLLAPVVDGDVLPSTPWTGLSGRVDLMVGHTRHEQRLLSVLEGRLGQITEEEAIETAQVLGPDPQRYQDAYPDPEELYDVARSDWLFRMPSLKLGDAQIAAGGTAYLYELAWPAPGMGGALGACHGLDVPLVFGNLTDGAPAVLIGEPTEEARWVSDQMRTAWIAFATNGTPGWPAYDADLALTRIFDREPAVTPYPETVSREIWLDYPEVLDLKSGSAT